MYPAHRYMQDASEPERAITEIVTASHAEVRALESRALYGVDINESTALANQTRVASDPLDIDVALAHIRAFTEKKQRLFGATLSGEDIASRPDWQGDQQIGFDVAAWDAAYGAATAFGIAAVGEEDEFRALGARGPAARAERIRALVKMRSPFAIVDPLDGTNQAVGMGQRSGWASCAMGWFPDDQTGLSPGELAMTAAVHLGDGRCYLAHQGQVWLSESAHPDRSKVFFALSLDRGAPKLSRSHYVIPAGKRSGVERAAAIMKFDSSIEYISPLGGNPGILAALYGASAVAAMQPSAYAWDHVAALILATGGFPVFRADDPEPLTARQLSELFIVDLSSGRKTETLYMGKTEEAALKLRAAALGAMRE